MRYQDDLDDVDWAGLKSMLAADRFDNGRTPEQLRRSFQNSFATCLAVADGRVVGTARVLSDGVCNAYLVDVWTHTPYRQRGVAREMIRRLMGRLEGQHLYTFTDDAVEFYKRLGFAERPTGLDVVVGQWLENDSR